jgi:signal transduction histidine kinase
MPSAFDQVMVNLLINAVHAIRAGAKTAEAPKGLIRVSSRRSGHWAEIRVHDSGRGIAQEIQDRIFDPFTTKDIDEGTEQGLAIAHDVIVNRHHGTIEVQNVPHFGSIFLRLPLADVTTSEVLSQ